MRGMTTGGGGGIGRRVGVGVRMIIMIMAEGGGFLDEFHDCMGTMNYGATESIGKECIVKLLL